MLKLVDEESNLLDFVLNKIGVEGSVDGELVERTVDLGKFITDLRRVERFGGGLVRGTLVLGVTMLKKKIEIGRNRRTGLRDETGRLEDDRSGGDGAD